MPRPALAFVAEPSHVRVVDHQTRFVLFFDRWYRRTAGRGYWRSLQPQHQAWVAHLEAPALRDWTAATVGGVIAIARAELAARGARGRLRITATTGENSFVSEVTLEVRVGDHRATLRLDAGVIYYELPTPILRAIADRVSRPTKTLAAVLERQRQAVRESTW